MSPLVDNLMPISHHKITDNLNSITQVHILFVHRFLQQNPCQITPHTRSSGMHAPPLLPCTLCQGHSHGLSHGYSACLCTKTHIARDAFQTFARSGFPFRLLAPPFGFAGLLDCFLDTPPLVGILLLLFLVSSMGSSPYKQIKTYVKKHALQNTCHTYGDMCVQIVHTC